MDKDNIVELRPRKNGWTDPSISKNAATDFIDKITLGNFDKRLFGEEIRKHHPLAQQAVFDTVMELLNQWTEDWRKNNYDARSQGFVTRAASATMLEKVHEDPRV